MLLAPDPYPPPHASSLLTSHYFHKPRRVYSMVRKRWRPLSTGSTSRFVRLGHCSAAPPPCTALYCTTLHCTTLHYTAINSSTFCTGLHCTGHHQPHRSLPDTPTHQHLLTHTYSPTPTHLHLLTYTYAPTPAHLSLTVPISRCEHSLASESFSFTLAYRAIISKR